MKYEETDYNIFYLLNNTLQTLPHFIRIQSKGT